MVEQEKIQPEHVRIDIVGVDAAQEILIKKYFDLFAFSKDQASYSKKISARFTLKDGKNIVADFFVVLRNLLVKEIDFVDAVIFVCDLRNEESLSIVENNLNGYFGQRLKENAYLIILALDAENEKELKLSHEKVFEFAGNKGVNLKVLKESEIKKEVNEAIEKAYEQYCNHRKLKKITFKKHWQNKKKKGNFCSNCGC